MRRAARFCAAAFLAVAASACSPAVSAPNSVTSAADPRSAWAGEEPAGGARVVLELLEGAEDGAPASVEERDLLARVALLPDGAVWYRVHEIGSAATGVPGAISWNGGPALVPPSARANASARERLLYLALVDVRAPAAGELTRRTRLLAGPPPPDGAAARWDGGGGGIALSARVWSARERADFLAGDAAAAASQSPDPDATEQLTDHE